VRCACIDIGSNTTRLLVAEPAGGLLREVDSERVFIRLVSGEPIPADRIALVTATVCAQIRRAQEAGAKRIRAVATAAIRDAPNGAELCAAVTREAGVRVAVLTTDDEARLAFAGATQSLSDPPSGEVAVVDVGGGSSEIVTGTVAGGVGWSASLPIGSGLLAQRHLYSDPPAAAELDALRREVAGVLRGLTPPAVQAGYAVGGGATSLRRVLGAQLDPQSLTRGMELLSSTPSAALVQRFALHPERARIMPAAVAVLDEASRVLGVGLELALGGLREGVILDDLSEPQR
jgi:exopolyphosphatase / guanosine-5'-triphosphate,3'-diphosphate pyrophosphatase